ncbi:MAG: ATPase, T2SS/T4P/T4SS family [Patescibacteria group bacterium]|nr:ATPase, T2SS/T4P/T4SS family [Patescibacteria group bacterium]
MVKPISLKAQVEADSEEEIFNVLKQQQVLSSEELDLVVEEKNVSNRRIEEVLLEKFSSKDKQIVRVLAGISKTPLINLAAYQFNYQLAAHLPLATAEKFKFVIFDQIGDKVFKVATPWPTHPVVDQLVNYIEDRNSVDLELYAATQAEIEEYLRQYREQQDQVQTQAVAPKIVSREITGKVEPMQINETQQEAISSLAKLLSQQPRNIEELKSITSRGYVPQMIAGIISFGIYKNASDIHFQPLTHEIRIRYRIDGVLSDFLSIKKDFLPSLVSRIKILANLRIDENRKPQDGRFGVEFHHKKIDLRISTLPTVYGEKIVMRILEKEKKLMSFESLGVAGFNLQKIRENIQKPYGMVIVTGPTGSGKSTTLYAALSEIHRPDVNIVTLEDPVEYEIEGVSQSQIKPQVGFNFANGLRSILRQDPDVIMIGEIRDKETAEMAVHAALTGHLVLSTLHTNNAAGAIPRLIDMGIEPFLIGSALNLVVAQRLVRKICPYGKKEEQVPKNLKENVSDIINKIPKSSGLEIPKPPYKFYKGVEDSRCHQGYSGRIGVFETIEINEQMQSILSTATTSASIFKQARNQGAITMFEDALVKAAKGQTSLEEALRVSIMGAELKDQM